MNRVFIRGDLHGKIEPLLFNNLDKDDILIILGDFGLIWDKDSRIVQFIINVIEKEIPYTVAFIDGNHENFIQIKNFTKKIEKWHGGLIDRISNNLIHLRRGEIYNFNDKRIGVCGGANSIDKIWRVEGLSWWAEEEITDEDIENFKNNLKNDKYIDIMLTHDCPENLVPMVKLYSKINDNKKISNSQKQLEKIYKMINFDKWYFGHWHLNYKFNNRFECLYDQIKQII